MIRVLNIVSDTNIGGAGRAVLAYLGGMDRGSFEAAVLLPRGSMLKGPVEELGIQTFEIDAMRDKSFDRAAIRLQKQVIRDFDPDIVHTHGSLSGRIAGKRCGKRVVFTRHSAFPFPAWVRKTPVRLIYRALYEHYADRIVVISPAGAKLLTDIGVDESKLDIMMNGAARVPEASAEELDKFRRTHGISPGELTAGILARIEEYKGHLCILEALRLVLDHGVRMKLIIAGTGSFENEVRAGVERLGLGEYVIFTGFVSDVSTVLSAMDIQINASYVSETSSLSLIEGMSLGIPMAASDCCGNPWVVDDGVSGLLFTPQDPAALAECLERLSDEALRRRLGEGAREAYEARFTAEHYAHGLENVYRKALGKEKQ